MHLARGMVVKRYRDLIAWQMGDAFKKEVFRLVQASEQATKDFRFRSQLLEAARSVPANIAEGFLRFSPGDFGRFLSISLGSLGEAESRLKDGIQLGYFQESKCAAAFNFGKRCAVATVRLKQSQK